MTSKTESFCDVRNAHVKLLNWLRDRSVGELAESLIWAIQKLEGLPEHWVAEELVAHETPAKQPRICTCWGFTEDVRAGLKAAEYADTSKWPLTPEGERLLTQKTKSAQQEAWDQPGECIYPICGCKGKPDCKRASVPRTVCPACGPTQEPCEHVPTAGDFL